MSLVKEGQIIRNTWEVECLIGEGSFAEVYRVKHRFLGRQAMKLFKLTGITSKEIEEMLEEAVMLSKLGHPNIIRVFDANTTETSKGTCGFFTMEYVAGGSLDNFWRSHGMKFVPIITTIDIIRQVCRGIAVAHGEKPPLIHRDIKPQNILVGYDAMGVRIRISDFGLAKRVNPLTLMASARGTRIFKAPEVFKDFHCDSCTGDVWSIGTTLYLLLTDQLPFNDIDNLESNEMIFDRPFVPPSYINLKVDKVLDQIVLRALSINPKERFPTAKELLYELDKWTPQQQTEDHSKKEDYSSDKTKSILGPHAPANYQEARKLAAKSKRMAKEFGKLAEAADIMEEACNKWPALRQEYEYTLKLWRRGLLM